MPWKVLQHHYENSASMKDDFIDHEEERFALDFQGINFIVEIPADFFMRILRI
jgi:hypothetical protein